MANLTATVAVCLMQTLAKNITARRTRVKAYWELLGNNSRVALIPHKIGSACLTQVVRIMGRKGDDDPASRAIESLSRAGYEVRGSYVPIHLIPAYEKWTQRRIPHVEAIWSDLIELPCEPDVSLDHVERIAAVVTKVLNS